MLAFSIARFNGGRRDIFAHASKFYTDWDTVPTTGETKLRVSHG